MSRHGSHDTSSSQAIHVVGCCPVSGKRMYESKAIAKAAKRQMLASGEDATELRPYLCEHCQHHHLGSARVYGESVTRERHRAIQAHKGPKKDAGA